MPHINHIFRPRKIRSISLNKQKRITLTEIIHRGFCLNFSELLLKISRKKCKFSGRDKIHPHKRFTHYAKQFSRKKMTYFSIYRIPKILAELARWCNGKKQEPKIKAWLKFTYDRKHS